MQLDSDFYREKVKTSMETSVDPQRPIFVITAKHSSGTGSSQKIVLQLSRQEAEALKNQLSDFLFKLPA